MNAKYCKNCGAVTVEIKGISYSMPRSEFKTRFPGERCRGHYVNCNYCVNHWGIDLCGCESGEKFGKCKKNLPQCIRPTQSIEEEFARCSCYDSRWETV
jgi:hypothetical protein